MDRLPPVSSLARARPAAAMALVWLAAWAPACEDEGSVPSVPGRVVAVAAGKQQGPDLATFCDVRADPPAAKVLTLPPLDQSPRPQGAFWRWVNVWATWCRPCVEEMPMIVDFRARLVTSGSEVELLFVTVDESAEDVARFRREHPSTPESLRVTDRDALEPWIVGLGLDAGAPLPFHLFADPDGRLRCGRSGALGQSDFDEVAGILAL